MKIYLSLADNYAEATECNLATLEELLMKKSSSKCSVRRQKSICLTMLRVCEEYSADITWRQFPSSFPRTEMILGMAKENPERISGALDEWISGKPQ